MIIIPWRFPLLGAFFLLSLSEMAMATDSGDTNQPYTKVSGRTVTFSRLTKSDLGLRCTVYLKDASSLPEVKYRPKGMLVEEGKIIIVNGEFNELGKHFLIVTWYNKARYSADFFSVAEEDIDHIELEKK